MDFLVNFVRLSHGNIGGTFRKGMKDQDMVWVEYLVAMAGDYQRIFFPTKIGRFLMHGFHCVCF